MSFIPAFNTMCLVPSVPLTWLTALSSDHNPASVIRFWFLRFSSIVLPRLLLNTTNTHPQTMQPTPSQQPVHAKEDQLSDRWWGRGVQIFDFSSFTTASCPLSAAHDSDVLPYSISLESTSALLSSNSFTTASCPSSAAYDNGVRPSLSFEFTSAPFSRSSFTTASCPFFTAHNSGV